MATTPGVDFSAPIYVEETASDPLAGVAVDSVDLNDPALLSEPMDLNADIDAYATPPPIPDGRWRVKIKSIDVKGPDGQPAKYGVKPNGNPKFNDGKPYAFCALQANVVQPGGRYDNATLTDYFVSTARNRNGGIPMVRILTVLGVKLPAQAGAKTLVDLFLKTLAAEPELEVETQWEGGPNQEDQKILDSQNPALKVKAVYGMHRFPLAENGKEHVPEVEQVITALGGTKMYFRAQARIAGYFPLGSGAAAAK
jgi:hypothetical protein